MPVGMDECASVEANPGTFGIVPISEVELGRTADSHLWDNCSRACDVFVWDNIAVVTVFGTVITILLMQAFNHWD